MVKKFKELVLTEDTTFEESIEVENSITYKGSERFSLKVNGNINALDINARDINAHDINAHDINAHNINALDINARDIDAHNINALDINARDIDAHNINALDIICEKRTKKSLTSKTIARVFIKNKSTLDRKEQVN